MMDWDNVRFFLTVARSGSIRAAAVTLGVNHATVSRRIAALEQGLGVRLFDKLPSGYQITSAGEEILQASERMESQALTLERQIFGRDQALTGSLRVTLPQILATELLMSDLTRFAAQHPGISLELLTSYDALNLTKRQADVALRMVETSPPEHLYGRRLASVHRAVYLSTDLRQQLEKDSEAAGLRWILKEEDGAVPAWASKGQKFFSQTPLVVSDPLVQLAATRKGLGASVGFCFAGDPDPTLCRLSPDVSQPYGDLWVLTHGDLRHTPRVQAFMGFIAEAVIAQRDLVQGQGAHL